MALEWLGLALAAAALNGCSVLAAKPSADRLGTSFMWVGAIAMEGATFGVAGLLFPRGPGTANAVFVVAAVTAGVLGAMGYLFFFAGMRLGTVGLVGTISATTPLLIVVLSVAFLSESLGSLQILGIAMTIACVLLLTIEPRRGSVARRTAVALSLGSFVVWGLWGFLVKASVETLGEGDLFLLLAVGYLVVAGMGAVLRRKSIVPQDRSLRMRAVGLFVFLSGSVAGVILAAAYDVGPASLVAPVAATYPVIATLGAWALLREKLDWRIGVALVLFVLGVSLLSAT